MPSTRRRFSGPPRGHDRVGNRATVRIVAGIRDMPAYRDNLTLEELDALVAFLAALNQSAGRPDARAGGR